jgi:chemotaxis protein methyltransferase CheR
MMSALGTTSNARRQDSLFMKKSRVIEACDDELGGLTLNGPTFSDGEFASCSQLAEQWTGVRLGTNKRAMLLARLGIRLRALRMSTIAQYLKYLTSERGLSEEKEHFVDVVTTHHTAFFREPEHYRILAKSVVPTFTSQRNVRVLSAACSTGEEVWTLGIVLAESMQSLRFELFGVDISRRALQIARRGVYPDEAVRPITESSRMKWFMRSRNRQANLVRVIPELRERASFSLANLTAEKSGLGGPYDVIFLRNVLIYFERDTQRTIIGRVIEHLVEKGWLFVGMSETADGMGLPLQRIGHSVYRRSI